VSAVPGPVLPTRFTLYLAWMAIRAAPTSAGERIGGGEDKLCCEVEVIGVGGRQGVRASGD
jgi:hypothetical protein